MSVRGVGVRDLGKLGPGEKAMRTIDVCALAPGLQVIDGLCGVLGVEIEHVEGTIAFGSVWAMSVANVAALHGARRRACDHRRRKPKLNPRHNCNSRSLARQ